MAYASSKTLHVALITGTFAAFLSSTHVFVFFCPFRSSATSRISPGPYGCSVGSRAELRGDKPWWSRAYLAEYSIAPEK